MFVVKFDRSMYDLSYTPKAWDVMALMKHGENGVNVAGHSWLSKFRPIELSVVYPEFNLQMGMEMGSHDPRKGLLVQQPPQRFA
jgi:hypothetical protein